MLFCSGYEKGRSRLAPRTQCFILYVASAIYSSYSTLSSPHVLVRKIGCLDQLSPNKLFKLILKLEISFNYGSVLTIRGRTHSSHWMFFLSYIKRKVLQDLLKHAKVIWTSKTWNKHRIQIFLEATHHPLPITK